MADQNSTLSFIFRVVDAATAPLANVGNALKQAAEGVEKFGEKISISMTGFQRIREMGEAINENLSKPISLFRKEMEAAAGSEESWLITMSAMMGSSEKAKGLSDALDVVAIATGRSKDSMQEISQSMIPFIASTETITELISTFSDISYGSGIAVESMSNALVKAASREGLGARELKQLSARIPIYESLAKVMGKTTDEVRDMEKINPEDYVAAMRLMTQEGGRYYQQTEKQSASFKMIMLRWDESTKILKETIGNAITNALGTKEKWESRIKLLNEFREKLTRFIEAHPVITKIVMGLASFLAILGPLVIALGVFAMALTAVKTVMLAVGLAGLKIVAILLAVIAVIAFLVVSIMWVYDNWGNLWNAFKEAHPVMKVILVLFGLLAAAAVAFGISLAVAFWPVTLAIAIIAGLIVAGKALYDNWEAITAKFIEWGEAIKTFFKELWEGVKGMAGALPDWFKEKMGMNVIATSVGAPSDVAKEGDKIKGDVTTKILIGITKEGDFDMKSSSSNILGLDNLFKPAAPIMVPNLQP